MSNAPIDVWREYGTDIMICVRTPGGGETVYMGGTKGAADAASIEHAVRWLTSLREMEVSDGKHT
jgi:hypothetical protein